MGSNLYNLRYTKKSRTMPRKAPKLKFVAIIIGAVVIALGGLLLSVGDVTGKRATGDRLARMQASPQWNQDKETFDNALERIDGSWFEMTRKFFFGGSNHRQPDVNAKFETARPIDFDSHPESGLRITWMGHSSFLVELDGTRTLVDPIWSERASPFTWAGPKRFYAPPITLADLPQLDAIIISHDHYDHLDRDTVVALAASNLQWLVPMGVGAHLEHWGVPPEKIAELDWWESRKVGNVTITATPSRHFSGRAVTMSDQNATLWAGWAWKGPTRSVFYSGNTALHYEFENIGKRLGPFDVTLMEIGAYNQLWADVHLGPEQAVLAHQLVQGNIMIPVHWGLFDLALHGWTEPAERVVIAAKQIDVRLEILRPGASFDMGRAPNVDRWWPELPWQNVVADPAWSSHVEKLQEPLREIANQNP